VLDLGASTAIRRIERGGSPHRPTAATTVMGARAEVPASPSVFLAVHDLPPKRETLAMTPD
jgi:hypothetical protein